jgi:hypothetical protein
VLRACVQCSTDCVATPTQTTYAGSDWGDFPTIPSYGAYRSSPCNMTADRKCKQVRAHAVL